MSPMNNRLLRSRAKGGFDPKSISGLIGWWDASDTANVTLDSGRVSGLTDKSGSGRNATNTTSGSTQPSYELGARNGLNVARFAAASSQELTVPSITIPNSHTVFHAIYRSTASVASHGLANTASQVAMTWASNNLIYQQSNGSFTQHGSASSSTGGFVITTRRTGTSSIVMRRNFALLAEITTGGGVTVAASGSWTRIGNYGNTFSTQDICEILAYNVSLTDAQVESVEKYLLNRWGISY